MALQFSFHTPIYLKLVNPEWVSPGALVDFAQTAESLGFDEIEHPCSPELHEGLLHWLTETPDDFRQGMPETRAGEGVLTLDVWGYCQRVCSGVAD